jgi:hypothetical protein
MKKSNLVNSRGRIDFEPAFMLLNEELFKSGQSLELVCAGGYVMQLHGYKSTSDVDAFFQNNSMIETIIRNVGNEFGINKPDEFWLNSSIANMNPQPPEKYCKLVYSLSNLIVRAVDITYLIGMKLESGREQDLRDLGGILKQDKNEKPFELLSILIGMGFDIDISGLLDAYERAHGMEWLDEFYVINQDELRKYF